MNQVDSSPEPPHININEFKTADYVSVKVGDTVYSMMGISFIIKNFLLIYNNVRLSAHNSDYDFKDNLTFYFSNRKAALNYGVEVFNNGIKSHVKVIEHLEEKIKELKQELILEEAKENLK